MNPVLEELAQEITALVLPLLQEKGLELIEVNCIRQGSGYLFQLFIDRPGRVLIEDCALINRQLSQKLEEKPLTQDDYWLEVSSPGLDRPLKTAKDFSRVYGQEVHIFLRQPWQGKHEYQGILKRVNEQEIIIEMRNNPDFVIPLEVINKGLQVI